MFCTFGANLDLVYLTPHAPAAQETVAILAAILARYRYLNLNTDKRHMTSFCLWKEAGTLSMCAFKKCDYLKFFFVKIHL